jgi:nucleotide-binding universal stress UspA family protein
MTAQSDLASIRRILVALDASPESLAALEHAADLAARLQAELAGLFIEDEDLLNLARLPFAREVSRLTRAGRALDAEILEEELRAQAALSRRALKEMAEAMNLRWSFRVLRGRVERELETAASETDLLALGRRPQRIGGERLGRTTARMVKELHCSVLLSGAKRAAPDAPVAILYTEASCADAALALAGQAAREEKRPLLVIISAKDQAEFEARRKRVQERLHGEAIKLQIRAAIGGDGAARHIVERAGPRLLVLGCDAAGRLPADWAEAAGNVDCPVLVVRGVS